VVVTDKAKEKDLALLFHWLDYFYTEEGAMLYNYGLSAEQQAQLQDATYLRFGVDAAYTLVERDGQQMVRFHDLLKVNDGNIRTAMNGSRVMGLSSPMLVDYGGYRHLCSALHRTMGFVQANRLHGALSLQPSAARQGCAEQQQGVFTNCQRVYVCAGAAVHHGQEEFGERLGYYCADLRSAATRRC